MVALLEILVGLFLLALIIGTVCVAGAYMQEKIQSAITRRKLQKAKPKPPQIKRRGNLILAHTQVPRIVQPAVDPWEVDFVRNLRSAHHVTSIEPTKVRFLFEKDTRKARDGFKWTCKCGETNSSLNLKLAELAYTNHLQKEAEKAAASLGKFKLPAGINWSFDPEGK